MALPGCGRCGDPCAAACDHSYACKVLVALPARFVAERAICCFALEFAILSDQAEVLAPLSPASGGPNRFLADQAERLGPAMAVIVVRAELLVPQVFGRLWPGRRASDWQSSIPIESSI